MKKGKPKFKHDLHNVANACGIDTNKELMEFVNELQHSLKAVTKDSKSSYSISELVELIENIALSDPVYTRCAMYLLVMQQLAAMSGEAEQQYVTLQ